MHDSSQQTSKEPLLFLHNKPPFNCSTVPQIDSLPHIEAVLERSLWVVTVESGVDAVHAVIKVSIAIFPAIFHRRR